MLHVIWHLDQGGAQTYLFNLLSEQVADPDLEPCLVVLSSPGALSDKFEKLLEVEYLGMKGGFSVVRSFGIHRTVKKFRPRLVHSHSNNLLFNSALHFVRLPVVYTDHGGGLLGGRKQDYILYRYLYRTINRWISISGMMAELMQNANPSVSLEIDLVYNGVDVNQIVSTKEYCGDDLDSRILNAKYRVGIIGRLEHQKGVDLFLKTAASISEKVDDVVFIVIGDGDLRDELESLAVRLGIQDRTFFLGFRSDALSLLKLFSVFLFTSNFEPFGLVITEAMAARVPVVAVHTAGAVPEILEDHEDGFIVNTRNPDQVAQAVVTVLGDPATCHRITEKAAFKVQREFSIKSNAQGVKEVYYRSI
nr:glycosyltransferase family 4 protein [Pseudohalioglobus lutimaris]